MNLDIYVEQSELYVVHRRRDRILWSFFCLLTPRSLYLRTANQQCLDVSAYDTRGQSIQIGVIILFAFAIIAFTAYQAVIVPQQNQQVEFDHNQEVQRDIVDTRNAIVRAANAGQNGAASIQLGQSFPARIFALNAPTANGRFATTEPGSISIGPDFDDDGTIDDPSTVCPASQDTVRASYTPNYSYYNNAPTTKYENTFVFNEFDYGTELVRTQARLLFGEADGEGGTGDSGRAVWRYPAVEHRDDFRSTFYTDGEQPDRHRPCGCSSDEW
ncbi:MAG: hypothetical protein U5K28_06715 [Halobacteriales archaeon]|nr:hypothetical protein [Halobacteriales archaeon]